MFDSSLGEWALILLIALLVLGPQRVLTVVKVAGLMLGKAKATLASVQEEVQRDMPQAEVAQLREELRTLRGSNVRRRIKEELRLEEKQG